METHELFHSGDRCQWKLCQTIQNLHIHKLSTISEKFQNSTRTMNRLSYILPKRVCCTQCITFQWNKIVFLHLTYQKLSKAPALLNNMSLGWGPPFVSQSNNLCSSATLLSSWCMNLVGRGTASEHQRKAICFQMLFHWKPMEIIPFQSEFNSNLNSIQFEMYKIFQLSLPIVTWGKSGCHHCWHPWLWYLSSSVIHHNPLNVDTDDINSQRLRLLISCLLRKCFSI
jgi:hypothetical protein